jgi:hypothetical protein
LCIRQQCCFSCSSLIAALVIIEELPFANVQTANFRTAECRLPADCRLQTADCTRLLIKTDKKQEKKEKYYLLKKKGTKYKRCVIYLGKVFVRGCFSHGVVLLLLMTDE